ncbi:beta-2-microglobulin [Neosynchiropus ocellatus]
MKLIFSLGAFLALFYLSEATYNPPKVKVYSQNPGKFDAANKLICHVTDFHPPDISISLLRNGQEIDSEQSDLAFSKNWQFHLSYHTQFTPISGDEYSCRVTHNQRTNTFLWDPKM